MNKFVSIVVSFVVFFPLFLPAEISASVLWQRGIVRSFEKAAVSVNSNGRPFDPVTGRIISLNRARMDSHRSARERAVIDIVRQVTSMRVDAYTTYRELLKESSESRAALERVIEKRVKVRHYPIDYFSSGCRVELSVEKLLEALPFRFPREDFPVPGATPLKSSYTGLIIDARKCNVVPMLIPSVFSENGLEIYGRNFIDYRKAVRSGVVKYVYTEDEAMTDNRVGDKPYYAVALRGARGCPVLSDRDIRKILSSSKTVAHLKNCRVIFIVDRVK